MAASDNIQISIIGIYYWNRLYRHISNS